jgi:hypothetical protein
MVHTVAEGAGARGTLGFPSRLRSQKGLLKGRHLDHFRSSAFSTYGMMEPILKDRAEV